MKATLYFQTGSGYTSSVGIVGHTYGYGQARMLWQKATAHLKAFPQDTVYASAQPARKG
jgi:hypothetical protein